MSRGTRRGRSAPKGHHREKIAGLCLLSLLSIRGLFLAPNPTPARATRPASSRARARASQGQGHGIEKGSPPLEFRVIQYISVTVPDDQAWRPLRGAVGRLCSSSRACHGLAERWTAPAYPTEVRGVAGGFRV